ncbi:TRAP-type C4-dicarboxylate transport system permease small subunit [Moryella indoligenes]|uniref:TRAP-type C4-dicarboxylate transport system permease small subunit n=1 Tax=Moryella indoligenes TaxID=371674 RepID=A0AAE3V893_9FIRM|nr:TRAP transporter small permease [Moryella indoligenes]MDQ0151536.1 TRAP-type C4-dicarboxylate transport system permease small subunit [Moryella indoligenes]
MTKEKNSIGTIRSLEHGLVKVEDTFLCVSLVVLTVSILIQIVGRYILKVSTPWCEELARYLFIALTYVGSGRAFINNGHINIDLMDTLIEKYSGNPKKTLTAFNRFSAILTQVFIVSFTVIYISYLSSIAKRPQESASMHINMLIPMSFVLIGLILMVLHCACRLFYDYEAVPTEQEEE